MIYSTQHNIISLFNKQTNSKVAHIHERYPNLTGKRTLEAGLRMQGKYKSSLPHKPLLSIITVCYNSVKTIERCILSVLEQDYDNVEYIIIDGGSTDGTLDIIKQYEDAIDYIISEPDCGIYEAMNKGVSLASGDAINMMNSDDRFIPNVLGEYAQSFIDKDTKLVYAFVNNVDEKGVIQGTSHTTFDSVFFDCVAHQTVFIRKDIVEQIGYFDASFLIASDAKFLLEAYLTCKDNEIVLLDKPTVLYFGGGSSGIQIEQYNKERVDFSYEIFGKQLGLTKEFISFVHDNPYEIALPVELVKEYNTDTVLRAILNLQVEPKHYELFINIISQYCHFSNIDIGYGFLKSEVNKLQENWWYQFGQVSKKKKIGMLISKCLKIGNNNKHDL